MPFKSRSISFRCGFPFFFCPTYPTQSIASLVLLSSYLSSSTCLLLPQVPLLPRVRPTVAFLSATFSFFILLALLPSLHWRFFRTMSLPPSFTWLGALPSPTLQPPSNRDHGPLQSISMRSTCVLSFAVGSIEIMSFFHRDHRGPPVFFLRFLVGVGGGGGARIPFRRDRDSCRRPSAIETRSTRVEGRT